MGEPRTHAPLPQRLEDFEIVRELGRGGMGIVYEAQQLSLKRKVALKVLSGSLGLTAKAVLRFRREAEAAAKLHHTNIVPIYATGEENGTHYYAMELIAGPSLDRVLRQLRQATKPKPPQHPLPPAEKQPSTVDESPPEALPAWVEQSFAPAAPPRSAEAMTGQSSSDLGSGSGYFDTVAAFGEYFGMLPAWQAPAEHARFLLLLGRKAEAIAHMREARPQLDRAPSFVRDLVVTVGAFLTDPNPEAARKYLQAVGRSRRDQAEARFLIGLVRLADGDRDGAREQFEAAVATHCFYFDSYNWSRAYLARMKQDRDWPRWIPSKR